MDVLQIGPRPVKSALLAVAPIIAVLMARTASAAYRLATTPPGVVLLSENAMVIVDSSVFKEPLRLVRSDVAAVSPAPIGSFAFRVSGPAARANAALVSLYAERPNVLVQFSQPRRLTMAKWNYGLQATYSLRSPTRKKAVNGLWLRTEDERGRDRLFSWAS